MAQWFGPKRFGYGIGPCSWQGWLATAMLLGVVLGSRYIKFEAFGLPPWSRLALIAMATVIYFTLTYFTYEPD